MLKLIALVALFAGFCWFGTQIPLGSHTLFGHLHAISETKESQDLFDGTKQSARPLVDDVRRRIAGVPAPAPVPVKDDEPKATPGTGAGAASDQDVRAAADRRPDGGPAQETLTASERRRLRRLISSAESASARR
jgi:hypothetical protein